MPERKMLPKTDPISQESSSLDSAELNMRRALGLFEGGDKDSSGQGRGAQHQHQPDTRRPTPSLATGARPRQRFVQDGEVPVTMVNRHRPHQQDAATAQTSGRVGAAEAALEQERTARTRAERSLQESLANVRDLNTKLAHAELARQEAADRAASYQRAALAERASLDEALAAERALRTIAERSLQEAATVRERLEEELAAALAAVTRSAHEPAAPRELAVKKPRKARSPSVPREPKPVKWWIPKSSH